MGKRMTSSQDISLSYYITLVLTQQKSYIHISHKRRINCNKNGRIQNSDGRNCLFITFAHSLLLVVEREIDKPQKNFSLFLYLRRLHTQKKFPPFSYYQFISMMIQVERVKVETILGFWKTIFVTNFNSLEIFQYHLKSQIRSLILYYHKRLE